MQAQYSSPGSGTFSGSVLLFIRSKSNVVNLSALYNNPDKKDKVFKTLKIALVDAAGGIDGFEILKIIADDLEIILHIKFIKENSCRKFLDSYRSKGLQQSLIQHTKVLVPSEDPRFETQLKTYSKILDDFIAEQDKCVHNIMEAQPNRLKDDEIEELETRLKKATLNSREPPRPAGTPCSTFLFQDKHFDDRKLTGEDQQTFAKKIGKSWKKVGRCLQKTCRALQDPAIDNLAYEYDREGLYEQAYQMLGKFMQAEGKKATLSRLISALEETELAGVAELILGIHH
ncbi:tumor necrosis factor receptor type 1-associated DEATH domain protein [Erpetoichthys calabaricus]|uniref:Tumor necrosis factor receptor type 1-associated DEATH domain protein n=1 Tax=Erpetoichthys calabaricus TaxID=27687 RepID=A0A8C4S6R7_ERPCA|nr:tumor necrosis factor receptor type 1-associated DEATH domain protein [Erpetoichthys calabaricus]